MTAFRRKRRPWRPRNGKRPSRGVSAIATGTQLRLGVAGLAIGLYRIDHRKRAEKRKNHLAIASLNTQESRAVSEPTELRIDITERASRNENRFHTASRMTVELMVKSEPCEDIIVFTKRAAIAENRPCPASRDALESF